MAEEPKKKRPRGSISFPYADLDYAIKIAGAIWASSGLRGQLDRVAARTGHKNVRSGTFRLRVAATRLFGLVTTSGMDIALTDLGRLVIDPNQERHARVQAFLNVELYQRLYNQHRGSPLPGPVALEQEMKDLGVAPNQLANARQVFMDSARQAGFFDEMPDRLIEPAHVVGLLPVAEERAEVAPAARSSDRGTLQHPLIEGLFTMLPPPGGRFTAQQQARWLEAAKVNLALVYGADERTAATPPPTEPAHNGDGEQEKKG